MCRGCLFVIVDIPSGGDIDGCWKMRILEDLMEIYPNAKQMLDKWIDELDEEKCFVGFFQPQPKNKEEFSKQAEEWYKMRQGVIAQFKIQTLEKLKSLKLTSVCERKVLA